MVWTDIDAEFEVEFNRWYDEERISRLLEVPGLSAGRYMAVRGDPKYLTMYKFEDHNVLRSTAYLDTVKYQPSPQRAKIGTSRVGRNFLRNAYRQIFRCTLTRSSRPSRWRRFCRCGGSMFPPRSRRSSTPGTIRLTFLPIWPVPGCLGARRFVAVEGQPKCLTVYEFEHAKVSERLRARPPPTPNRQ